MTDGARFGLGALVVAVVVIAIMVFGRSDPAPQSADTQQEMTVEETADTGGMTPALDVAATAVDMRRDAAAIDGDRIIAADSEPQNWLAHGRTYSEQRYSPLDNINTENVGELGLEWVFETGTDRGLEASPIVVDGTMYLTGSWSIVYALDALTGEELWSYDPEVPREWGRYACCDVVNRGVAVWEGKVYVGTIDGYLIALDAGTGEELWKVDTINRKPPYTITGAPRVVKGKVIIGNGGAEYGVRGYFTAYDADTGELQWRFYTVPGNPAEPFEHPELEKAAETWTGEWWNYGGGGTAWDSMAYDPELDLLYVGTGNGSPWNRNIRSPEGGDNLYLSSILAIDPDDGSLKWHYQTTPGESWDYTATQHIILADMEIDGTPRKVLMQAPKNGFFYVLDRETGELLSAENYVPTLWASHVDMKTGRPVENPGARYDAKDGFGLVGPIPIGGHNWHPMAYNPNAGLVYIPAMEISAVAEHEKDFEFKDGSWNVGQDFRTQTDAPPELFKGRLLAWDPVKQKEAWRIEHWGGWNGGVLTTAGNLVFQGTGDGYVKAHNAETGKTLWQAPAGTGVIAPPVTWSRNGEQYVTVLAGWGGAYALAYGRAAKQAGVHRGGSVLTFKLGGTAQLDPVERGGEELAIPAMTEDAQNPELVAKGAVTFAGTCAVCHGLGAVGGGVIADLRYSAPEVFDMYEDIVLKGAMKERGMANFSDVVDADDVRAIKAYIISRAHEGDVPTAVPAFPDRIWRAMGIDPATGKPLVEAPTPKGQQ